MSIVKEYYENGTLKSKGIKQNGLKEGAWMFYYENGNKKKEVFFRNDIEDGEWKMWHEKGKLYIEQIKTLGKSEGYWKEYYENGNIKEIGEYKNDEYFPIDFWDEKGNKLLSNGTGKKIEKFGTFEMDIVEHYFENGKFIKEIKISSAKYGSFSPNSGTSK